jgi:formate dehydrogenase major subunit
MTMAEDVNATMAGSPGPESLSRRGFLQAAAASAGVATVAGGAVLASAFGFDLSWAAAEARELKIARTTQTHSVCPYCAVGCSVVIHTLGDKSRNVAPTVVHVEGDPESPINRGTLCPKGISLKQFIVNERRLMRPLYRAPGASEWVPISWDLAFERMARRIKATRDDGFEERDFDGRTVNRLANVALIGGCTDTNEVNFLLAKLRFALGIQAYENQARL